MAAIRGAAGQRVRAAAPNSDDDPARQAGQRRDARAALLRDARGRFRAATAPQIAPWPVDPAPHEVLVGPNARIEPGDVFFRQDVMDYQMVDADHDVVVRNAHGEICLIFNFRATQVALDHRRGGGYEWRLQHNNPPQQFIGTRLEPARAQLPLDPATGAPYTLESYQAYRAEHQRLRDLEVCEQLRAEENRRRLAAERQKEASERAEALLAAVLTPEEYLDFNSNRPVHIKGSAGGDYQIRREGLSSNICQVVDGRHVRSFCVHPNPYDRRANGYLPDADGYAAQILALRADEPMVLRETIVSWYAPDWSPYQKPLPGNRHH